MTDKLAAIHAKGVEVLNAEHGNFDYVAEANLTLSPEFHGDLVSKANWSRYLNDAISSLQGLDKVKKSLFYGKDNGLQNGSGIEDLPLRIATNSSFAISELEAEIFIHGAIGIATEACEMLELLRNGINGDAIDLVNLKEEIGDAKWYMAILAKIAGFKWGDDERVNIAKLRQRFPNRFTEYDANNRKLDEERAILEAE